MIRIQKLKQPQKGRSGVELTPGKSAIVSGCKIVNNNKFTVFVAKFSRPPVKNPPTAAGKKKKNTTTAGL